VIRSLLYLLLRRVLGLFRSDDRAAAEAELENATLRHQVGILLKGALIPIVALTRGFPLAPFGWSGTRRLFP
jgi:hypothetical protein